jgi:hypothetical protein
MPSSVISSYCYDAEQRALEVCFVSGRRYLYHDVPERTADAMRKAGSKGSFFNRKIKDRFEFTRCG